MYISPFLKKSSAYEFTVKKVIFNWKKEVYIDIGHCSLNVIEKSKYLKIYYLKAVYLKIQKIRI